MAVKGSETPIPADVPDNVKRVLTQMNREIERLRRELNRLAALIDA